MTSSVGHHHGHAIYAFLLALIEIRANMICDGSVTDDSFACLGEGGVVYHLPIASEPTVCSGAHKARFGAAKPSHGHKLTGAEATR